MTKVDWKQGQPPMNERLLLIVSAAGAPRYAQLMDCCEIAVGYWDGNDFLPLTLEPSFGLTFKVRYWATLRDLPPVRLLDRAEIARR